MSEFNQEHTFNQVDEQLAAIIPATVLVENNDGTISTALVTKRDDYFGRVHHASLNQLIMGESIDTEIVSADMLSDTHQEKLAAELAGVALRPSVVAEIPAVSDRTGNNMPAGSTSLRPGYWSRPTEDQIDNAAKYGFDLSKQSKYYS